jgi:hypothetical protein
MRRFGFILLSAKALAVFRIGIREFFGDWSAELLLGLTPTEIVSIGLPLAQNYSAFSRNDNRRFEHQVLDSRAPQIYLIAVATSSLGRYLKFYGMSGLYHSISMA